MRVSKTVGEQVRRHRERKGWSQARLADELLILGEPIDRVVLHRIEKGTRGISVDEVLILALALGVSPIHLMMPKAMVPVQVAAGFPAAGGFEALSWLRGAFPLIPSDAGRPSEEQLRFFFESCSDWEERASRRHPHVFEAWMSAGFAMLYATEPGQEDLLRLHLEHLAACARLGLSHLDSTLTTTTKGS